MIRAAAVRMYFPSPSGFRGIGETGKVTGIAADDDRDTILWGVISRGIILTGTIRLRLWTINNECAVNDGLRSRMPKAGVL